MSEALRQAVSPLDEGLALRTALSRAPDSQSLVRVLRQGVGLTQGLIAEACEVSDRSVREWEGGAPPRARHDARLRDLADVVGELLGTMTPRGVQQWLAARNRRLAARSPAQAIAADDTDAVLAVIAALKGGDHG